MNFESMVVLVIILICFVLAILYIKKKNLLKDCNGNCANCHKTCKIRNK